MIERVDTRGEGLSPGKYTFIISSVPEKGNFKNPSKHFYQFHFLVKAHGEVFEHRERIPVWQVAPFLRAMGVKETEEGVFDWDKEDAVGRMFDGEISLELNPQDGKRYRRLINPVAIQGYPKENPLKSEEENQQDVPF